MIVVSVGRRILSSMLDALPHSLGTTVNRELFSQALRFCLNESTFVGSYITQVNGSKKDVL